MNISLGQLLIVDDSPSNRELLSRYFGAHGYEVAHADCGAAALNMIKRHRFDAVLLDILMPEIDGIEVLKTIRQSYTPAELPVIVVSGRTGNRDINVALELGANDYITKPIDFVAVWTKLQRAIGTASNVVAQ